MSGSLETLVRLGRDHSDQRFSASLKLPTNARSQIGTLYQSTTWLTQELCQSQPVANTLPLHTSSVWRGRGLFDISRQGGHGLCTCIVCKTALPFGKTG